jgi:hypothetical protein
MLTLFLLLALESSVPAADIDAICKGAAVASLPEDAAKAARGCQSDEASARDMLRRQWGGFTAAAKDECSTSPGMQFSYVELLTCLQMQNVSKFENTPAQALEPKPSEPIDQAAPKP